MFSSRVLSWSNGGHVATLLYLLVEILRLLRAVVAASLTDWNYMTCSSISSWMHGSDQIRSIPHRQALCLCVSRRDGSRCWKEKAPFVDFTVTRPSSSAPSGPIPASYSVARAEATDTYCPGSTNLKSDMATIIHDINALLRASQGRSMSRL